MPAATPGRLRILVALLQGVALWWLYSSAQRSDWPATDPAWFVGLLAPALLVPPFFHLLADDWQPSLGRRIAGVTLVVAAMLFGFGWHQGANVVTAVSRDASFGFALAVIVLCVHALPFVQSALTTGRLWPDYRRLFVFAWRNALLVVLACVFTGVFWLLLLLWMKLFELVEVDFFADLFTDSRFAIPATTLAFAAALGVIDSVERLHVALRQQILTLFKWLAVLALLILALFSVAVVFRTPALFANQERAVAAAWLLWLIAVTVYLLNAAYQDGEGPSPYPSWLSLASRAVVPLLLVIAALAGYALFVRVVEYGLTVERVWGVLVGVLALVYSGGYAWAALRRGPWMAGVGVVNVVAALLLIVALALMLSPVLSPHRLTAADQYRRAVSGDVERPRDIRELRGMDAFGVLASSAGRYGRDRLRELEKIADVQGAEAIRARASEARKGLGTDGPVFKGGVDLLSVTALPEGTTIDASTRKLLWAAGLFDCTDQRAPCPVLAIDLDEDGTQELLVFGSAGVSAFTRAGDTLKPLAVWSEPGAAQPDGKVIVEAMRQGRVEVSSARWRSLRVNGQLLEFSSR